MSTDDGDDDDDDDGNNNNNNSVSIYNTHNVRVSRTEFEALAVARWV